MSSADESMVDFVKADDGEALQALFEQQCDEDGLMTKASLVSIPMIADLLVCSSSFYCCLGIILSFTNFSVH